MLESKYQAELIKRIKARIPDCLVVKNDCNYIQGIPDLTVYYGRRWAFLEVKTSEKSKERSNQRYYIEKAQREAFAAFIYPEVEEEILHTLELYFMGAAT